MREVLLMRTLAIIIITISISILNPMNLRGGDCGKEDTLIAQSDSSGVIPIEDLEITVIYDNRTYQEGLETAWGFACLIRGSDKTILFDTGGDGEILMSNMEKVGIDPASIDQVFLSHEHWDHTGGLRSFLDKKPSPKVYILSAFPNNIKSSIEKAGGTYIEADQPLYLCSGIKSTGAMGRIIKEHSLILETSRGLVVITGCAHPGIVKIVEKTKEISEGEILLVMGGFHLLDKTETQLEGIISEFRELNVRFAAPCHCSGDEAIAAFRENYGDYLLLQEKT
jgi:7,8-dihydropterin-6-yl-methyl-4-(beta-D-ribofuranosyl)aminobenzene 5'-phosphate synthase